MDILESKIKFVCGLSDGENLTEGKGILERIPNEDSPWWKLQKHIKENRLEITSFGLWAGDKHFNLPSRNPKFGGESPIGYNCFRRVESDMVSGGNTEWYICAEAIYPAYKIQLWIDENDHNKSWVNVVKLKCGKPVK